MKNQSLLLIFGILLITVNTFTLENKAVNVDISATDVWVARNHHAMAYDAESDRVILFGGFQPDSSTIMGDTWAYDYNSNTWTNMHPANSPENRLSAAMTYDSALDKMILFGGLTEINDQPVEFNDTWAYDYNGNTWEKLTTSSAPSARIAHRLTYDSESNLILMQGGHTPSKGVSHQDIWTYNYSENNWTQLSILDRPSQMDFSLFTYDEESDRIIAFGSDAQTWEFNVNTNNYSRVNLDTAPIGRLGGAAVYNPNDDKIILFGGTLTYRTGKDDLWVFDLNEMSWTEMTPTVNPAGRFFSNMAYDIESDRAILFGGGRSLNGIAKNDTWSYNLKLNTWEQQPFEDSATDSLSQSSNRDDSPVFITPVILISYSIASKLRQRKFRIKIK